MCILNCSLKKKKKAGEEIATVGTASEKMVARCVGKIEPSNPHGKHPGFTLKFPKTSPQSRFQKDQGKIWGIPGRNRNAVMKQDLNSGEKTFVEMTIANPKL